MKIKQFFTEPCHVKVYPMLATLLLEYANVGQLIRMWTQHSAKDQAVSAWFAVFFALLCYWNFYRVCAPEQKWARRANAIGMAMNLLVCFSAFYLRWTA